MKQVCLLCERISPDKNLYCQETYCPAEMSPTILDYGEWLGDIEIVKPVAILRAAVLYEATHQKQKVYVKVAHPGEENRDRLKREAEFLKTLEGRTHVAPNLPVWRPPYASATVDKEPYGRIMLRGHLLYFYIFNFFEGEPLRDIITQNPQLWVNHVGWIVVSLASAIAYLNSQKLYHFGLSPDAALVRFDGDPSAPRVLLFDLGIVSDAPALNHNWYPFFVLPAYTAPELVEAATTPPDFRTDVYGLGLTLYELLVGEPPYTFKLHSDSDVYNAVLRNRRVRMNREEDVKVVADIASRSVNQEPKQRQANAVEVAQQLMAYFGPVPEPKKSLWTRFTTSTLVRTGILLLGAAFIMTLLWTIYSLIAQP